MDAPIRVLYAEDDPRDVDLTRSRFALEQPAFELEIVDTGEQCWACLQQHEYDILLLDYRLPDMDGLDLLKRMVPGGVRLPTVMVTGLGDEEVVIQALRLGAIDYVPKSADYLATLPSILKSIAFEYRQRKTLAQPLAPLRRRVLYIERHQMDIDLTVSHFSEAAPHLVVTVVRSCAEALQLLPGDHGFDLVMADLRMPDMSALDFFRVLKHRGAAPPFVVITGQGDEETAVAALKLGAADYIVKRQNYLTHLPYTLDQAIARFQLDLTSSQLRQEIVQRQQVEAALRENEERLARTIETMPSGLTIIASDGQIVLANQAAEKILGLTRSDMTGRAYNAPIWKIAAVDGGPFLDEQLPFMRVIQTDQAVYDVQHSIEQPDGTRVILSINAAPLHDASRHFSGAVAVLNDITDRMRAGEALRESEEKYRSLFANMQEGVALHQMVYDARHQPIDYRIVEVNPAFEEVLGLTREQAIGQQATGLYGTDQPPYLEIYAEVAATGMPVKFKTDFSPLKKQFDISVTSPKPGWFATIFTDITERKRAEDALQRRAAQLMLLSKVESQIAAILELKSVFDTAVCLVQETFGYHHVALFTVNRERSEAVMAASAGEFIQLFPPDHRIPLGQGVVGWVGLHGAELLANDVNVELRYTNFYPDVIPTRSELAVPIRAGGSTIGVLDVQSPQVNAFDENDVLVIKTLVDQIAVAIENARLYEAVQQELSERKQAEDALRRSAQRLAILHHIDRAMLAAQSPEAIAETALLRLRDLIPFQLGGIVLFDADETLVLAAVPNASPALYSGLRLPAEPGWIAALQLGQPILIPDLSASTDSSIGVELLKAASLQSVVSVPLLVHGQLIGTLNLVANTRSAFKPEHVDIATEVADQIAVMLRQARLHEQVQRHADELEQRVAMRTRELTQANAQLAAANERLTELDRLKSKFVSDVSHELRTPVTGLSLYVDLLDHGKPEKRDFYIAQIGQQMARLRAMINEILDLSRLERDQREVSLTPIDLNAIVEHVVAAQQAAAEAAGLQLTNEVAEQMPLVMAQPEQLSRTVTNLVANAIKYTRAGSVHVATLNDGVRVGVQVSDTGIGIAPEDLPHVFDRFYRGKQVAQSTIPGTGLGLAIVKEIVEAHGGTVEVESTLGVGSTFRLWLPVVTG